MREVAARDAIRRGDVRRGGGSRVEVSKETNIMRKFMFLFRGGGIVVQPPPPPAEIGAHLAKWTAWVGGLVKAGHAEVGPPPLENGGEVVRGEAKGVRDGPDAEAKGPVLGS